MKRTSPDGPDKAPGFAFGNLRLEPDGTLLRGQTPIHLPAKELAALRFLLAHPGEIVSPAQLKAALWSGLHVTSYSVPRCLSSLRARLAPEDCIQTIYKRGYRFITPVRMVAENVTAFPRLAILPFATGPYVAAHLGSAVAEEIVAGMTAMQPQVVSVVARDSVFTLAGRGATALQVGEELGADLALTGTLLALPLHLRLRAEMIRIGDGTQIWVEDLLVKREQVAALASKMLERLASRLGGERSPAIEEPIAASQRMPDRPEAYEMFLQGHHDWQTLERHHMQDGMRRLLKAIELDPSLVAAQVDLVQVCVTQALFGFMAPLAAADQIRRIAAEIPQVAGEAPSILSALGWIDFHIEHDLLSAMRRFTQSAQMPHDAEATRLQVMFAVSRHRFGEACQMLRSALLVDPFAPWLHGRLAWAYHLAGRSDESLDQVEKCLELFPEHESTGVYGAIILAYNGDARRAAKVAQNLVQRTPYFDIATAVHAYTLAREGHPAESRSMLERLQWLSRERFVLRSFAAGAYAALGDEEGAIRELLAAEDARCPWFFQTLADPRLRPLHGHPQFARMLATLDDMESTAAGDEGPDLRPNIALAVH